VNPTQPTIDMLTKLQEANPAKTKSYGNDMFIFMHEKTKIDIFIQKTKIDTILKFGDIEVAKITETVNAKKSYNRFKDWKQLKKLASIFYTEKEFETFMNA
jgi:hypothetical protein